MKSKCFLILLFAASSIPLVAVPSVVLTETGVRNLGIETAPAEETDFEVTSFALGRTAAVPQNRSVLSSRIPGRVIENRLQVGSFVNKGDKLILLESRQPGDPPPAVWLTAPADGTITSINTSLGAPVEPTDRLAELADLRTIYLVATMPQSTAGKIVQGTEARVHFPLRPKQSYTATLLQFAACPCPDPVCALGQDVSMQSTNESTSDLNTAGVVFTLKNPDNQLRPGMSAECTIIMEKRERVLSVPREAVQGDARDRHVFVKHDSIPYAFQRVSVQTGMTNAERVEIVNGLSSGDEVVTKGAYSLGFAGAGGGPSLKEALDMAHGHEHHDDGSEIDGGAGEHNHDHADDHADHHEEDHHEEGHHEEGHHGLSRLEVLLMSACAILATLLVISRMRRRQADDSTPNAR